MTNEETDTALILENELKRRVGEIVESVVHRQVQHILSKELAKAKVNMMMEISVAVGKMLRLIEEEDRKPLWEFTPQEFGLTKEDLNTHNISGTKNAIRE